MLLATTIASQPPFLSSEFSRKAWIFFSPHRGRKRACRAASGYPLTLHSCTPLDFCDHPNGPPASDIHHASLGDAPRCRCSGATATGLSLRNRPLCLDVYSMSLRNRPLSVTQKSSLSTSGNVPRLTLWLTPTSPGSPSSSLGSLPAPRLSPSAHPLSPLRLSLEPSGLTPEPRLTLWAFCAQAHPRALWTVP